MKDMKDADVMMLHVVFMDLGVSKAILKGADGTPDYEYIHISDYEFQYGMVGNILTNYEVD